MSQDSKVLAVDLDGTLIKSDLLLESFMLLIRNNPLNMIFAIFWLLKGKAYLKARIAAQVDIPVELLPFNSEVVGYLEEQKASGRKLVLATASHRKFATQVAEHTGLFDQVFATEGDINLSGSKKRDALIEQYGEKGFVYAGNEAVDLDVWSHSAAAVVVGPLELAQQARGKCGLEKHINSEKPSAKVILKALRVHQWVKNALIFVPLVTAHQIQNPHGFTLALLGFIAFSLCASSVYFLNDMLDLNDDRRHATKCKRPFAAGTLPLLYGVLGAPVLLLIALLLCIFLPFEFFVVLLAYYILTLAYSFRLKRVVMVDVIALASLYTVRIIAGAAAVGVALSFWLLSFSIFVFLSLAIIKRYTELLKLRATSKTKALGRGYQVEDLELLSSLGGASGYISVLVLALYINSPDVKGMYDNPVMMWPACLVMLYWISRIWIIAHRGNMDDDPIVFALKDKASVLCGALIAGFMVLAV